MENYFNFFNLPVRFFPDEGKIRQQFMQNDVRYHTDFHKMESPEQQMEQFEMSEFNQDAYDTLMDFDWRVEHILMLHQALPDNWDEQLDPEHFPFLAKWQNKLKGVDEDQLELMVDVWMAELDDEYYPTLEAHDRGERPSGMWKLITAYFLIRQYLYSKID